jgi:hypothetical protein
MANLHAQLALVALLASPVLGNHGLGSIMFMIMRDTLVKRATQ